MDHACINQVLNAHLSTLIVAAMVQRQCR